MEQKQPKISLNFIAGIISVVGSFLWVRQGKQVLPVFQLKMQAENKQLLEIIKARLGLPEKIYQYAHQNRHYALLLVRKRSSLEKLIIPTLKNKLYGPKQAQFNRWMDKFTKAKGDSLPSN
ncbi:MAG: LAGLIDADG family homing endonuclease [Candidatus Magasanikbacteria bacterium]|nr:LAGLIDADG family homing endonuclease [Candidatus Magasanikbacteria bacterium]